MRVITKQRRFAAVGRRGMCCAPSSIRVSSWLLTPCSLSRDRSWPGRSPGLSPAPQCKPCWRLWRETKVRNAKLIGLNEISRSSSLCSWPAYAPRSSALADIGDIRPTDNRAATIHVRGKGGKERSVPIEAELLSVIEAYLDSRAIRFLAGTKHKAGDSTSSLSRWPARSPLFVGRDGERITRRTLQSRIKRSFKRAGSRRATRPRCPRSRASAYLRD